MLVFLKVSGGFGVSIYLLEFLLISRSSAREHGERPVLTVVYRVPGAGEASALETEEDCFPASIRVQDKVASVVQAASTVFT